MVAFHALPLQKKIGMLLILLEVQQSVFQLQRPASDISFVMSSCNDTPS